MCSVCDSRGLAASRYISWPYCAVWVHSSSCTAVGTCLNLATDTAHEKSLVARSETPTM